MTTLNKYHEPILEKRRHEYPFLLDYVFASYRSPELFGEERVRHIISEYLGRHIRQNVAKKDGDTEAVIKSLIEGIQAGCNGKDIFGTDSIKAIANELQHGNATEIFIGLTGVVLHLKRFGDGIGIKPQDAKGAIHRNATEIFEGMATYPRDEGGYDSFDPFVQSWTVTMPRWQTYGNKKIDVAAELASARRYVPDVEWRMDIEAVTSELLMLYIGQNDHGIAVGQYHGIPVSMSILFGGEERDQNWRKGSVTREEFVLAFCSNSSDSPYIR
ncbi:MAG: hypothetical protein IPJ68_04925 [Candidatus Moraniibacteriota bacterium]|nr:MAG: hypothetical protein IPJ68_04925 [Candidatus Moranbacteria bacterium]